MNNRLSFRRFIAQMTVIVMVVSLFWMAPAPLRAAADGEDADGGSQLPPSAPVTVTDSVYITLGETPEGQGMTARPGDGPEEGLQVGEMDGKTYWKTNQAVNPNDPAQNILYFYFNVDDDFAGDLSDQDVLVTAEYFDQGNGDMVLQYDSKQSAFKDAPLFSYENSGTWKTHTFKLSDARFENRTNGADFRIGVTGAGAKAQNPELYLAKVTVTKQPRESSGTHETKVYDTVYPTDDIIIADRSVTDYGAKGDGSTDDTRAFQEALADAGSQGGGVVFVPSGTYRLTSELVVPTGVTLRGDWANPEAQGGKVLGTVLAVYAGKGQETGTSFIKLQPSSGVTNLSIWYPEQNASDPSPYPWTIEQLPGDSATVKNVTLVNAYQGIKIGPDWNELHYVKNLYGTTLKTGIFLDYTTDIGRLEGIHLSPDLWSGSGLTGSPERGELHDYMTSHAEGIVMGRSDWEYMSDIHISGYETGMRMTTRTGSLESANAQLYKIQVEDCHVALKIEGVNNYGLLISDSRFEAGAGQHPIAIYATQGFNSIVQFNGVTVGGHPDQAVLNEGSGTLSFENSSFANWGDGSEDYAIVARGGSLILGASSFAKSDRHLLLEGNVGTVNSINSGYDGKLSVTNHSQSTDLNIRQDDKYVLDRLPEVPSVDIAARPKPATSGLFNVVNAPYSADPTGNEDASQVIQQALSDAGDAGGGTVYMPAGIYRVEQPLVVPTGVELRGNFDVPHHTIGGGTVIFTNYGENEPDAPALIQLKAAAGLRGISVYYDHQTWTEANPVKPYPWTVQGQGKDVYLIDTTLVNPYQAVDFGTYDTSGHYIDYVAGSPLKEGIYLGGGAQGGYLRNVQFNPHYYGRSNYPNHPSTGADSDMVWSYQKDHLDAFRIGNVKQETIFNTFVFGSKFGIHFEGQDGQGPEAVVIGHGTDGSKKGAVLEGADKAGLQFINTELVSISTTDKVYVEVGKDFGSKAVFFNSSMWGDTNRSFDIFGGTVRIQQANFTKVGDIGINAVGGDIGLYDSYFQQSQTTHVYAGPGIDKMVVSNNLASGGLQIQNDAPGKVSGSNLYPVTLKLEKAPFDPSHPENTGTVLSITNAAGDGTLKGQIEWVSPGMYEKALKPIRFDNLKKGETRSVAIPYLSADSLKFRVALDNGERYETSVKLSQSFASRSETTDHTPTIEVSGPEHYYSVGGSWGGADDLGLTSKVTWDEAHLYVNVDVKDNVHSQTFTGGDIWQGDSLQVGIDLAKEDGAASRQVNELGFALNEDGSVQKWRWRAPDGITPGPLESVQAVVTRDETAKVTHYELTLPFEALHGAGYDFRADKPIGLALLVNENDGDGRSGFMEFNGGIGTSKDAGLFGNLYLLQDDYVKLLEKSAQASVKSAEQKKDVSTVDAAANFVLLLPDGGLKKSLQARLAAIGTKPGTDPGGEEHPGGPGSNGGGNSGSGSSSGSGSAGSGTPFGGGSSPDPSGKNSLTLTPALDQASKLASVRLDSKEAEQAFGGIQGGQDGTKTLVVQLKAAAGAEGYALELPSELVADKQAARSLDIHTELGNLWIPGNLLAASKEQLGEFIVVSISKANRAGEGKDAASIFGERPAVSVQLATAKGVSLQWTDAPAPIKVMLPYQPGSGEAKNPEKLVVRLAGEQGQYTPVPSGKYVPSLGHIAFKAWQPGVYAVGYDEHTFQDIGNLAWARQAVEALAAKGIVHGVSESAYQPQTMIRRADFAALLVQAFEFNRNHTESAERFADVPQDAYYNEAVGIARELGIVQGGGTLFLPDAPIKREDAAVMIYRAMDAAGILPAAAGSQASVGGFADSDAIAAYARDAVQALADAQLLQEDGGKFHPKEPITRAETAVLVYRLYNLLP
ncbi:glycosyl hydrolase family 28-related protein [Paenibacillus sp. Y412MC10]|uniref:glycosyl hydrolase family 28-related protein n=1 Tax=Geobacillus sp. (strain Y412MC10) TaxID=481743 RepID=UPI001642E7AD|nr:glycosyl hydrolase family 28-related protein [Paenibacillus sp. Y412MC10]